MPVEEKLARRNCIPIIYTRGTHYEVGYDVGRTFGSLIHSFLQSATVLNEEYIPAYETVRGKQIYEDTLNTVKKYFPQYIKELEGTADGAKVPFYKLFLLHLDNIILNAVEEKKCKAYNSPTGCSTICVNSNEQILGHTEDALAETLNHFYFVSAHIISETPQGKWDVVEERFTSLCYAGHLPGYTMNYNHHGLVFSVNTLSAQKLKSGKIPRHFLARALLSAENFETAQKILRDSGCGAGDGCSINMTFLYQEGDRLFHNAELAPAENNESQLSILTTSPDEFIFHVNMYQRLEVEEVHDIMFESSVARTCRFQSYNRPQTNEDVITMLSDTVNKEHPVFRDFGIVKTIAIGIFDCIKKTWALYADKPSQNEPLIVLPLVLKDDKY